MFLPPPELEESIFGSLRALSIMGQAMELYIPKVFEMFILTLGGTIRQVDQAANSEMQEGAADVDPDSPAPGIAGNMAGDGFMD